MSDKTNCKWCDAGDSPELLDEDGVKSSLSGKPGTWCHAYGIYWWPCENYTLTSAELQQYHAYATACESDLVLAAEVRAATRAEWEAWGGAVRDTVGVPDDELPDDARMAYVKLQRAEIVAWQRLR